MASMGSGNQAAGPLLAAIRAGNVEIADKLVNSINANSTDKAGRNCIHVAAAEGNSEAIQMIHDIEGDLDLQAKTKNQMTALAWARQKEFSETEAVLLNPPRPGSATSAGAESDDSDEEDAAAVGGEDVPDFFDDSAPHEDSEEEDAVGLAAAAGSSVAAAAEATHNGTSSAGGSTQGSRRSIVGNTGHKYGQPMRVEGWMRKHGGTFRPWRNRFFMLEGRTVWYFANENSLDKAKAKGVMRLVQGSEVLVDDSYTKPYCFNINTPQRKYIVQAANDEEMIEWMEALQNNLDVCPPEMALEEWDDVDG